MSWEQEGVVKYHLNHVPSALPASYDSTEIIGLRNTLESLHLVGVDDQGLGFGNISQLLMSPLNEPQSTQGPKQFIITGTQTGHIKQLEAQHLSWVQSYEFDTFTLSARGPYAPSSEAFTHASIYENNPNCRWIVHVHAFKHWPDLVKKTDSPFYCVTNFISYGTIDMVREMKRILSLPKNSKQSTQVIVMAGHEGGIISFAPSSEEAYQLLTQALNSLGPLPPI